MQLGCSEGSAYFIPSLFLIYTKDVLDVMWYVDNFSHMMQVISSFVHIHYIILFCSDCDPI